MPSNPRHRMVYLILSLLACSALAVAATGPEIAVDKDSLSLGEVEEGQIARAQFSVMNRGDAPLTIREIRTSCGCTEAVSRTNEIAPGQKAEVDVTYNSTGLSHGSKTQSVMVLSTDPKNPVVRVQVFADVIRRVSVEPTSLVASIPRFQEQMAFPVTIKNNSPEPVTVTMSTWEGAITSAVLEPPDIIIDPNSERRVSILVDLTKPEKGRMVNGRLSLATNHPSAKRVDLRLMIKLDPE